MLDLQLYISAGLQQLAPMYEGVKLRTHVGTSTAVFTLLTVFDVPVERAGVMSTLWGGLGGYYSPYYRGKAWLGDLPAWCSALASFQVGINFNLILEWASYPTPPPGYLAAERQ